jgi:hypothetical protein
MKAIHFFATYGRSPAEELGYLVGQLIAIAIILGVPVFALISVIKAFKRRTRGWIIAGSIGGAILAVLLLLVLFGIVAGFTSASRNATRDTRPAAEKQTEAAATAAVSTTRTPAKFSSRTEAVIAQLRKLGVNPSEQFGYAVHNVENAAGRFFTASNMIDTDAILDPTRKEEPIVQALQTFENTADDLVATIHRYKEQTSREFVGVNLTAKQREQMLKESQYGYDHIEAAAATAVTAAEAGIALRDAYSRGARSDAAQQRFTEAWNTYSTAMNTLITSVQKTQQHADEIYHSKP